MNTVTPTNPSICGGTDGQITINSTPATGLIYSVDGGNTWNSDNTFTGLTAGFYAVQIAFSDTTCMVVGTPVSLEDPAAPTVTNVSSDDPMTCGSADGQITISSSPVTGLLYSCLLYTSPSPRDS